MRWALEIKLSQHWNKFSALLKETGNKPIVEYSAKDKIWGAYVNLKRDMTDNRKSMDMLRAYRRGMNTTALLYVTGVASLLTATFVGTSGDINSSDKNFTIGLGLGALGIGLITGGYLRTSSIKQRLENAVDIYNR